MVHDAKLRILAIGCVHGKVPKTLQKTIKQFSPDIIIGTGDFAGGDFGKELRDYESKVVRKYGVMENKWPEKVKDEFNKKHKKWSEIADRNSKMTLTKLNSFGIPVYYVHGNWDSISFTKMRTKYTGEFNIDRAKGKNLKFIHGKAKRVGEYSIIGFGGYRVTSMKEYLRHTLPKPRVPIKRILDHRKDLEKKLNKLFRNSRKPTILITHDPPYGVLDYLKSEKLHYGEKITRDAIRKFKPKLCICTHFHEHQGLAKIGKTTVVNAGYGRAGQMTVIDLRDGKIQVKLIK